jgi:hypothetical protein
VVAIIKSTPFDKRQQAVYFVAMGGAQVAMDNPLKIDFNSDYRLAICRPLGLLGAEHAAQLLNFLLGFERTNPGSFNRLLDLTLVTEIQLSSSVIHWYAGTRREATADVPPFCTAIIAPAPSAEEAAAIFATLVEGSKIQVGIFRDASSAAKWLDVPEAVIQPEGADKNHPSPSPKGDA